MMLPHILNDADEARNLVACNAINIVNDNAKSHATDEVVRQTSFEKRLDKFDSTSRLSDDCQHTQQPPRYPKRMSVDSVLGKNVLQPNILESLQALDCLQDHNDKQSKTQPKVQRPPTRRSFDSLLSTKNGQLFPLFESTDEKDENEGEDDDKNDLPVDNKGSKHEERRWSLERPVVGRDNPTAVTNVNPTFGDMFQSNFTFDLKKIKTLLPPGRPRRQRSIDESRLDDNTKPSNTTKSTENFKSFDKNRSIENVIGQMIKKAEGVMMKDTALNENKILPDYTTGHENSTKTNKPTIPPVRKVQSDPTLIKFSDLPQLSDIVQVDDKSDISRHVKITDDEVAIDIPEISDNNTSHPAFESINRSRHSGNTAAPRMMSPPNRPQRQLSIGK